MIKSRLDLQLAKAGFSVGWDSEISASAATYTWTDPDDGNKRKLVLSREDGDGVPEDTDKPVQMGLYELDAEKGSWTMLVHDDFPNVGAALAAIEESPWNV